MERVEGREQVEYVGGRKQIKPIKQVQVMQSGLGGMDRMGV